ncbi:MULTISPECIES: DNA adenine methylase [Lacticaseibacillus]|uniref:DNA adenine methylase n=1 Tax=Lacticaseibacillus TaxID=2759736 RepID=UPI00069B3D59|nr:MULTISPECIES: Dam family site-specific DNA-(adenine-N6)-methyltransferase [Lacticaseibacillus]
MLLPKNIEKVLVPPIKIQGIKTKLVPWISKSIRWDGKGTWFEPFLGSGVVGFNIAPEKAVFSDNNPYIIDFYKSLQNGDFSSQDVRHFLTIEGAKLEKTPPSKESYYYVVRDRFNKEHNPLDFLFLQRSNFNGMIRFGPNGYNVPFGRKPSRFKPALITKIVHQIDWVKYLMDTHHWTFVCSDWSNVLSDAQHSDFTYLDPPYVGRSTDYFSSWTDKNAIELATFANKELHGGYALSMWYQNKYRKNEHIKKWNGKILTDEHFYFVGGAESNRNSMTEALVIKDGYVTVSAPAV